jgi:hypothetical protein
MSNGESLHLYVVWRRLVMDILLPNVELTELPLAVRLNELLGVADIALTVP